MLTMINHDDALMLSLTGDGADVVDAEDAEGASPEQEKEKELPRLRRDGMSLVCAIWNFGNLQRKRNTK